MVTGGSMPGGGPRRRWPARHPWMEEVSAGGLVLDLAPGNRNLAGREAPPPQPDASTDPLAYACAALIGRLDRRGRLLWSLPKGHVEPGETWELTAVREVAEETGICGRVLAPLGTIDFRFVTAGRRVHKTVHHFLLLATGGELSDADGEVSEVAWVPLPEVARRLAYDTERQLVARVPELLAASA